MQNLSRAELTALIRKETEDLVLGTALLFLAAGSLWSHLALGALFLEPAFFMSWLLIHSVGFVCLRFPRLEKLAVTGGILALQLYYFTALRRFNLPYLPVAPIFFVASTLSLSGFTKRDPIRFLGLWITCWLSSALWIHASQGFENPLNEALMFAVGLNLLFFACFFAASKFSSHRIGKKMGMLGARNNYDAQRLHAAKLQTLGEMAAGIAHEINNPLAAINGYSHQIKGELAESNPPSVDLLQAANDRIKFNVDRIIEITKALRTFSRSQTQEVSLSVSIREVLNDSLVLMRSSLKSEHIDVHLEFPAEDVVVRGNFVQLSQLLVNLLSNARDACRGSDRKKITVGFVSDAKTLRVWVEDTGPGIPNNLAEEVFRAFFTTKDLLEGTGLGLYISKMIADRHHAILDFTCPKDSSGRVLGTRFELSLPMVADSGALAA